MAVPRGWYNISRERKRSYMKIYRMMAISLVVMGCLLFTMIQGISAVQNEIAAGSDHTVALKSDGTVVAWGRNYYGQCNFSY